MTPLESVLRRDRAVVLAAIAATALLAWLYLLRLAAAGDMGAAMAGMAMAAPAWTLLDALFIFLMWTVMMVGMMIPAAAPMLLIYAGVARQANARGTPFAATGWFALGYLLAWTAFAAAATLLQWLLDRAGLLTPMMASASRPLAGALLVAAGLYQFSPLKYACLGQCRSPLDFIRRAGGFRGDRAGALRLGLRHGLFCIGCCWALMILLFALGVMNVLWIAALTILVLAEKALPAGRLLPWASGAALVAAGAAMIAGLL